MIYYLSSRIKNLIGQFIGVGIILGVPSIIGLNPLVLPWTDWDVINVGLTAFWLIGITNAINLLDNMDGLAAGISAIAAFILAIGLGANGQPFELLLICAFIGALVGFLVFNFNPASIFMGDAGSMFVGFFPCKFGFIESNRWTFEKYRFGFSSSCIDSFCSDF